MNEAHDEPERWTCQRDTTRAGSSMCWLEVGTDVPAATANGNRLALEAPSPRATGCWGLTSSGRTKVAEKGEHCSSNPGACQGYPTQHNLRFHENISTGASAGWQAQRVPAARTGPRRYPLQALFHSYRANLSGLDQTLHPFPWQAPSQNHGGRRGPRLPDPPGRGGQRRRFHPKPGAQCLAFPVRAGAPPRTALSPGRRTRPTPQEAAGGADPR